MSIPFELRSAHLTANTAAGTDRALHLICSIDHPVLTWRMMDRRRTCKQVPLRESTVPSTNGGEDPHEYYFLQTLTTQGQEKGLRIRAMRKEAAQQNDSVQLQLDNDLLLLSTRESLRGRSRMSAVVKSTSPTAALFLSHSTLMHYYSRCQRCPALAQLALVSLSLVCHSESLLPLALSPNVFSVSVPFTSSRAAQRS